MASPTRQTDKSEFVIGPDYADAPELAVKDGVPKGTVHELTMDSKDSKFYPGIAKDKPGEVVPYQRQVIVYIPAGYTPGKAAPFIVAHDGLWYRNDLIHALDNLIFEKKCRRWSRSCCTTAAATRSKPARAGVRHGFGALRRVHRSRSAASNYQRLQRDLHERPGRAGDDGRQLRRLGGVFDGLVPPRVVSAGSDLLRHLFQSAVPVNPDRRAARGSTTPR